MIVNMERINHCIDAIAKLLALIVILSIVSFAPAHSICVMSYLQITYQIFQAKLKVQKKKTCLKLNGEIIMCDSKRYASSFTQAI